MYIGLHHYFIIVVVHWRRPSQKKMFFFVGRGGTIGSGRIEEAAKLY